MATVAATLAPGAGFANVTLTSWAGDATFATDPVAGGQIEAVDTVTVSADGTVTGSDGSYTLMYISPTGESEALSYTITNPDTVDPVIDTLTATGSDPDSIDVAFNTDEDNGTAYFFASASATETVSAIKAGAQGTQTVSGTGTQSLTLTLATGTYYVHALHEDGAGNQSNILVSAAVTLEALPDESATTSATLTAGTGFDTVTLTSWSGDADFATAPVAGGQLEGPDTLTIAVDGTITGDDGAYVLLYISPTGASEAISYQIGVPVESATTSATLTGGADYTTATLASDFDASVGAFQQWTGSEPAAGWQIETLTAEGYFDANGDYWKDAGVADGIQDVWVIQPDGTVTVEQFDNTGLDSLADTTPAAFSFTDVTGQPVSTVTESNIITITGVDAATDVAASITGGEYAVSTDDGATFGAYTSAATNVQLDDQIKVRVTTSANNSTGTSAAFTAGGVTDTFTATTEAEAASVLESTDLESASNVSSSNISQTHVLESQSLNTDSASSNTQISQTHSLSTENVEAIPTLSLPSFGDMIYALNSSDVESGTNVNTPLLFILSQLNARVSESLSETSNPMISQTHSILTNNVEALSLNSIPFFTGEVAPLNMNGIPVKESVVFSASKMPTSLKQGSYYALKFPVLTNGEAVVSVEDAKFSLYRSGAEVLTKSIVDTSLNFASSTFNVDLDDSETEVLAGLYTFEMWFVDMSGNNIHVRSGNINFEPTKVRFI